MAGPRFDPDILRLNSNPTVYGLIYFEHFVYPLWFAVSLAIRNY